MIITIGGTPGSGKTSIGKALAQLMDIPFISIGEHRSKQAQDHHMTLTQWNAYGKTHKDVDTSIETWQQALNESGDDFIIDGRLAYHFFPNALHIYLTADEAVRTKRIQTSIQANERPDEPQDQSLEDIQISAQKREKEDRERFQSLYNLDPSNTSNYDLIIDTTLTTAEEVAREIQQKAANLDEK